MDASERVAKLSFSLDPTLAREVREMPPSIGCCIGRLAQQHPNVKLAVI